MVHIVKPVLIEEISQHHVVNHRAVDELSTVGNLIAEPARQIIENDHIMSKRNAVARNVRTDEACPASD
jgi:hypothetical protein